VALVRQGDRQSGHDGIMAQARQHTKAPRVAL
jgi:hypothetical protein